MATKLDKPVTRRVPEITNGEGRALEATLTPEDGGSIALRWVGLRREPSTFRLKDLAERADVNSSCVVTTKQTTKRRKASGDPNIDRTEWIRYEEILTKVHITPMDLVERERIVSVIRGIRGHWEDLNSYS